MAKIDKTLLYLYSEDVRRSQPKVGKLLNRSPQVINYSIKRFEKEKIVPSYYALIDYSYLGYLQFKVYFRGAYRKRSQLNSLLRALKARPNITSIYEIGSEFDLLIEFLHSNPSEFNKELKRIISEFDILGDYDIIMNIVSHAYPKDHLLPKNRRIERYRAKEEIVVGGDRKIIGLTENEQRVIQLINTNPRVSYSSMSEEVGINIKTVIATLESLKKRKILRAAKATIDMSKIGMVSKKILLKLHHIDIEKENKLSYFCRITPEITWFSKVLGKWDIEIDIDAADEASFRDIFLKLREEFQDIIRGFSTHEVYIRHKQSYLPRLTVEPSEHQPKNTQNIQVI